MASHSALSNKDSLKPSDSNPQIQTVEQTPVKKEKPRLEDFELRDAVGIGNFGKVYKAFNKKADRLCALKVL